jgi:thymidylate synthase ThyX
MSTIEVTKREDGKLIGTGRGGISAVMIEDSQAECCITTMQLRYPRFIHAEFMTHRVFSRNASSSRAIPVAKMLEQVRSDPAMPIHWGKNQPGMQADEELTGDELEAAKELWRGAARFAANQAERMQSHYVHKQVANRILEPFQFINVIVTATEWDNFFELRAHTDAQPEIRELADVMRAVRSQSTPRKIYPTENYSTFMGNREDPHGWHLPYVTELERNTYQLPILVAASAARCARVSYLTHDGETPDIKKDIALFMRLVGSTPIHASPIEHQAKPSKRCDTQSGNFRGWMQFRQWYRPGMFEHFKEFV